MTNLKTIEDISLLGGHPALDFVNTVDSRSERWGPEFLNSYADLITWARRIDLINDNEQGALFSKATQSPAEAQRELIQAKELREALHRLFLAEANGVSTGEEGLELLTSVARRALLRRTLRQEADGVHWRYGQALALDVISDRIGCLAAELLTSRHERRPVRECQGRACGWLLDISRNGLRRWCSDKSCGSHSRVRKFRAARAG